MSSKVSSLPEGVNTSRQAVIAGLTAECRTFDMGVRIGIVVASWQLSVVGWRSFVMRFQEKAVIVTGGSKGIGEGCCRVFCAEGGLVAILARGKEAGESLAAELCIKGPGRAVYL